MVLDDLQRFGGRPNELLTEGSDVDLECLEEI